MRKAILHEEKSFFTFIFVSLNIIYLKSDLPLNEERLLILRLPTIKHMKLTHWMPGLQIKIRPCHFWKGKKKI